MNMKSPLFIRSLGAALALAITTLGAHAGVSMQLDRSDINSDETAELTVNATGNGSNSISPPAVPGLQFNAVGQSSQIEIINGSVSSTSTMTYEVTPQGPGNYIIPSPDPNGPKLTLHVHAGSGAGNSSSSFVANPPASSPSQNLPAPAIAATTPGDVHMLANGVGFLRMQMPKRDLYVGENVPVDIQLGLRSGMVAALNGLPTLNADAFTLNKLSDKPEQTQTEINGEPYTILTWHTLLAAVKPGEFSLSMQTPVTVRVRTTAPRISADANDPFNDPFFQNFFGGHVTEKEMNLASDPAAVKVLPLPSNGQPANFSGAVGNFAVSSEITPASGNVGDPLTLRLKVIGTGAFDRVENSMLSSSDAWKTYRATGKFIPADSVGYRGEKDFEQAVIPQRAGHQTVPPIAFSYFNPETRQYETLYTQPSAVEIAPSANPVATATPASAPNQTAAATPAAPANGLRPDMTETDVAVATLRPLYFQPGFVVSQAIIALAFIGAGFWMRRNEQFASDPARIKRHQELKAVDGFLAQMDSAAKQRDAATFFFSARQALQHALAWRWKMNPGAITLAEIDAHMNGEGENIRRVFALADELAYSGNAAIEADFASWKQAVHQLIKETETV
jgi:hypothetical protein